MIRPLVEFGVGGRNCRVLSYDSPSGLLEGTSLVVADRTSAALLGLGSERSYVIEPGEASKRWDVLGEVLARAAELGLRRDSVIAGLGGGVVCDLAALAAALYMRGT
ncbi:MAG TPA: 3-dehydroquinate synthase, partial [Rectinemataceae bacterium]|nr:3-dehydroquinate synthase [Rectinemataceae bacterium]